MLEVLLLYLLPFAVRVGLAGGDVEWERVVLSLLPVAVVAPTTYVSVYVRSAEREHVWRHTLYAVGFSVSVATSVRWDYVHSHWDECRVLVAYLAVGCLTLWWFVVSHILENAYLPQLRTHQGDVTVLPLTLVAIGTFVRDVPDGAFQFSRSVLFFVPVVVAWATLFFIAYHGFATGRTTTLESGGYSHHARAALVVASAHLGLLECNSPPLLFVAFPPVAALLCQTTSPYTHAPALRPLWRVSALTVAAGLGAAGGHVLRGPLGSDAQLSVAVLVTVASVSLPPVAGRRWVLPGALYVALGACAYLTARASVLRVADVLAVFGASFLTLWAVNALVAPVWTPDPPVAGSAAVTVRGAPRPQEAAPWYVPSRLLTWCSACGCGVGHRYTADTPRGRTGRVDRNCPEAFQGVWFMEGNTFPMDLVVIHGLTWSEDGTRAWMWDVWNVTRDATVAGVLLTLGSFFKSTSIEVYDDAWIRTCVWNFPWVRLLFDTYWIRRVGPDEMERLVIASDGRVVWRYSLLRVVRADGTRTRFHGRYVDACVGRRYLG